MKATLAFVLTCCLATAASAAGTQTGTTRPGTAPGAAGSTNQMGDTAPGGSATGSQVSAADRARGEQEIRTRFEGFGRVWDKGDAKGVATFFTDDAMVINPWGRSATGRADIASLVSKDMDRMGAGAKHVFTVERVRWLTPDVAFTDATQRITGARGKDGRTQPEMQIHVALLLRREGGEWRAFEARPYMFQKDTGAAGSGGDAPPPAKR